MSTATIDHAPTAARPTIAPADSLFFDPISEDVLSDLCEGVISLVDDGHDINHILERVDSAADALGLPACNPSRLAFREATQDCPSGRSSDGPKAIAAYATRMRKAGGRSL